MTNALPVENVRQIDTDISFYLQGIEMGARSVARNVRNLPCRRSFETLAEDEMEKAKQTLTEALQAIQEAQEAYQSLPVEA